MAKKSGLQAVGAKGRLPAPSASAAVVAALEDAERDSLRSKAREHTDDMLDVLVKTARGKKGPGKEAARPSPSTRRLAANDVLVWGYGRPAISQERAEVDEGKGLTIVIGELHVDGQPVPDAEEIEVNALPSSSFPSDTEGPGDGFAPVEYDVEGLADAPVKP